MNVTKLTAYIQFNNGLLNTYKELGTNIHTMVNEIIGASKDIIIPFQEFGYVSPQIYLIDVTNLPNDHELVVAVNGNKISGMRYKDRWLTTELLAITVEVPIPDTIDETFVKKITIEDKDILNTFSVEETNSILIMSVFQKRILDLITAANIAHFGSLQLFKGIIIQDRETTQKLEEIKCTTLYHASKFAQEIGYPKLRRLDFLTVWNWINKRLDFLSGFSDGATGRALSCFSVLFYSEHPNLLFRAIMGIEAIYAKGAGNLQEQVREKCQEFIGKQEAYKKLYTSMYDFRSRYIHGDLNFPAKYNISYTDKISKYNVELEKSTYYAIALLGATIQELIVRNWSNLIFTYNVDDSSKE